MRLGAVAIAAFLAAGCGGDAGHPAAPPDLGPDLAAPDLAQPAGPCGDVGGYCFVDGPPSPLPLQGDANPDPRESDSGLARDGAGALVLPGGAPLADALWVANAGDFMRGTVSRIDPKQLKETARYLSVTCPTRGACDGMAGCCARDSDPEWQWRKGGQVGPAPGAQAVQLAGGEPIRTAVDFAGDVWVINNAFGGQASVTRIAADPARCVDRNGNGVLDTSRDADGDGAIDADCNGDGQPDDLDGVKLAPCANGKPQEFFGLDDECVLFTTNVGAPAQLGRALAATAGGEAWAGTTNDGRLFRVDGKTGLIGAEADLQPADPACKPYGLVVDHAGIGWAMSLAAPPLCFFDTADPKRVGTARNPTVGQLGGGGVTADRAGDVWVACRAFGLCRYTPDRSGGWKTLGQGGWTMIQSPGRNAGAGPVSGVAVDSRGARDYFAFAAASNAIVRVRASELPPATPMMDTLIDGASEPAVAVASANAVALDARQDVWAIGRPQAIATRVTVASDGTMTAAGTCGWDGPDAPQPQNDASDPTGFALHTAARTGTYRWIQSGCASVGHGGGTTWVRLAWDADLPPPSTIAARVRVGDTPVPDAGWTGWTPISSSPADLTLVLPLAYLEVELALGSTLDPVTPALKALEVTFACGP